MYTFLLVVGAWNFGGSLMMLGFVNEKFAHNVLVKWSGIFKETYTVNAYGRMWFIWAASLNVFFGLLDMLAWHWQFDPLGVCLSLMTLSAYLVVLILSIVALIRKKAGPGIYFTIALFTAWIVWGVYGLLTHFSCV